MNISHSMVDNHPHTFWCREVYPGDRGSPLRMRRIAAGAGCAGDRRPRGVRAIGDRGVYGRPAVAPTDPEALHSAFPRHDVDADAIGQVEHRIVSVPIVQQAA